MKYSWLCLFGLLSMVLCAGENLVPNPTFQSDGKGGIGQWSNTKVVQEHLTVKDGALHIELPAFKDFSISSQMIELNQEKPVTLRYSIDIKGETFPIS